MQSYHKCKHQKRRRRRFLAKFRPKLYIKQFNRIRLPFDLSFGIRKRYRAEGLRRGYNDVRDFFSDLAVAGFEAIVTARANDGMVLDHATFVRYRERLGWRMRMANVDLNAVPLRDVGSICRSYTGIDVYDTLSILIAIGWSMNPDGLEFSRDEAHDRIYS